MATPWGTKGFTRVSDVIDRAIQQGCEIRTSKFKIMTPKGGKEIRYLLNPKTGDTFDITDYEEDEWMAPSSLQAVQRRLGVTLNLSSLQS